MKPVASRAQLFAESCPQEVHFSIDRPDPCRCRDRPNADMKAQLQRSRQLIFLKAFLGSRAEVSFSL